MSIEIKLSRSNRIYRPDEPLEGKVIAKLNSGVSYQSIRVTIDGAIYLQVRGGSAGVIEYFYGVIKPIRIMCIRLFFLAISEFNEVPVGKKIIFILQWLIEDIQNLLVLLFSCSCSCSCSSLVLFCKKVVDVRSSGRLGSGTTEIPFSVILKDPKDESLEKFYETYHGGNISIQEEYSHA